MSPHRRRSAFTLIEVLIVVVIMAVLAATIIPQFSSSTTDAKDSSLKFNMHTMRSQIELYKVHHLGEYPDDLGDTDGWLPQLTGATDADGLVGTLGDADYPFGPYIDGGVPPNPFNGKSSVDPVATAGTVPTAATGSDTGWQYDKTTGGIWPNHTGWTAGS